MTKPVHQTFARNQIGEFVQVLEVPKVHMLLNDCD